MFITVTNCSLQRVKRVRVDEYAQGRRKMEAWLGHSSLCSFKRGATGAKVPFHHRFKSREIFGVAKDFCPNFPKLSRKVFCATITYKFSPTKIMKILFGVTSKKGLRVIFCKPSAPVFEVKQGWAPFLRGFSGMLPRFSANQNSLGVRFHPYLQQAPLFFITVS